MFVINKTKTTKLMKKSEIKNESTNNNRREPKNQKRNFSSIQLFTYRNDHRLKNNFHCHPDRSREKMARTLFPVHLLSSF